MGWAEKREYKRAYFRLAVEVKSASSWQYVEAGNLSAGGMFVMTDKVEPAQTKMNVIFLLTRKNYMLYYFQTRR